MCFSRLGRGVRSVCRYGLKTARALMVAPFAGTGSFVEEAVTNLTGDSNIGRRASREIMGIMESEMGRGGEHGREVLRHSFESSKSNVENAEIKAELTGKDQRCNASRAARSLMLGWSLPHGFIRRLIGPRHR